MLKRRFVLAVSVVVLSVGVSSVLAATDDGTVAAPAPTPLSMPVMRVAPSPPSSTSTTSTTSTTTTTTVVASTVVQKRERRCGGWLELARQVGWPSDAIDKLDVVMFRESSCQETAFNPNDPNTGSYGLMQVNGYWCSSNKYNPDGWLQAQGVLVSCTDLYSPAVNLLAALLIWRHSGWKAWSTA